MFSAVPMLRVNILVLDKHVDDVARRLGHAGLVHLSDPALQSPAGRLTPADRAAEARTLELLVQRVDALAARLGTPLPPPDAATPPPTPDAARERLAAIEAEADAVARALDHLAARADLARADLAVLESIPCPEVPLGLFRQAEHVYAVAGRLPGAALPALAAKLAARALLTHSPFKPGQDALVVVVAARRNRFAVEGDLGKAGFKRLDIPERWTLGAGAEAQRLRAELGELEASIARERARLRALGDARGAELSAARHTLAEALEIARAEGRFARAERVYCISGWIPAAARAEVAGLVAEASDGSGWVDCRDARQDPAARGGREKVPFQFGGRRVWQPFQALISVYGTPAYGELDPTVFLAVSFVLMFGIMFGDAGHGLVLALAGLWLLRSRRPGVRRLRSAAYLLIPCGLCALAFGLAYGSVFGNEHLLPHLWLNPMERATTLFAFTVGIGILCTSVALVFNIVNKLRAGNWFDGVVNKFGIVGALFYWGLLILGLKAALGGGVPAWAFGLAAGVPLGILFLHEPLHSLAHRERHLLHGGLFAFVLGALIELMETVSSFMGGTISFIRVGAFALSHAALCLATYSVAELVGGGSLGWLYSGLVIVAGNIVIMVMEGMVASIQGVRLQFYELFSKYFAGDGLPYRPFRTACSGNDTE